MSVVSKKLFKALNLTLRTEGVLDILDNKTKEVINNALLDYEKELIHEEDSRVCKCATDPLNCLIH